MAHAHLCNNGEVSSCVGNLIRAFSDGLNVFKKLRERRRKRRSKHRRPEEPASNAELRLSNSLRLGPVELRDKFDRYYEEKGEGFARGDAIAHASLAETLIKLNTGLVSIIAKFLHRDAKDNHHLDLDYKSLTSLSEMSRKEAIGSLNQLYHRMSQSQLQLHSVPSSRLDSNRRKQPTSRQRVSGPVIARAAVKNSSETQLVVVRPKNTRKTSTSSTESGMKTSPSMPAGLAYASPSGSPLPRYVAKDPFPEHGSIAGQTKALKGRTAMPNAHDGFETISRTVHESPVKHRRSPTRQALNERSSRATLGYHTPSMPPYLKSPLPSSPPHHNFEAAIARRRANKLTPSMYTFASDSTKLGEIPQHNWTVPWNYAEAERLNALAAMAPLVLPVVDEGSQKVKKRGLFGFMRRRSGAVTAGGG